MRSSKTLSAGCGLIRWSKAVALLVLCLLELSSAVEIYVDGTAGSDTPTCGLTVSTPCLSMNFTDMRASEEPGAPHTLRMLPGTYRFINDTMLYNGGAWNRLVGDPANPRMVVLDGEDTTEDLIEWKFSDNNQSGPFYFEGLTFMGFTSVTIQLIGMHLDVRNCIFDYSYQEGALSVMASTDWRADVPEEERGSNTSTLYVDNVLTINGKNSFCTGVICYYCYNATIKNSQMLNNTDSGTRGSSAVYVRNAQYLLVENVDITDTYTCATGAMELRDVVETVIRNVNIHNIRNNTDDCWEGSNGHVELQGCLSVDIDGMSIVNATAGEGTGIHMDEECQNVTIRNSHFENLFAMQSGGAIYVDVSSEEDDSVLTLEIVDCTFVNNEAVLRGGAIEIEGDGTPADILIENCDFRNHRVTDEEEGSGGTINIRDGLVDVTIRGGSIADSYAEFGGVFFLTPAADATLTVDDVTISRSGAGLGGVLHFGGSEVTFSDCEIYQTTARESGGAFYVPNGVGSEVELNINSCAFRNNSAGNGGTLFANGGLVNIDDSTIAYSVAGLGGGLFFGRYSTSTVTDSKIVECNVGGEGLCVGLFGYGAGVYFEESACLNQEFSAVLFENNLANVSGGAYYTQDISCGDDWCTDCDFTNNQALGSGATAAAPFESFKAEHSGESLAVTLGQRFFLDVIPYDALEQSMSGDHELINARLVDPSEAANNEVYLCGDLTTTASRGLARFAFTAYLLDTEGGSTQAKDALNAGNDVIVPLQLEPRAASEDSRPIDLIDLSLRGCPPGFEVDAIPERELRSIMEACPASELTEGDEAGALPPLRRCIRQSNLTAVQRVVVLVLASLTLTIGTAFVLAACLLRKNRIVWSSSPFMMMVAAVGFYAMEAAAFLRAFRPVNSAMCMGYMGLFVLGINVLLGSAIMKNLRVWKIFTLKSLRVLHIANWKLIVCIFLASVPDLLILIIQSTMFPLTVEVSVTNSTCDSDTAGTFLALYAVMKTLWIGAGIATCWLIRKVPAKFNESKSTFLMITCVALGLIIIWGIGAIVLTQERTIMEVFMTALIAVCLITITLVPKLMMIYRKRDGTLMSSTGATQTQTQMTFTKFDRDASKAGSACGADGNPAFEFKVRFKRLKEDLTRTQKLYERSYENTGELRERFRAIESDLVALQLERDYRADVGGEDVSDVTTGSENSQTMSKSGVSKSVATKSKATGRRLSAVKDEGFEEVPQNEGEEGELP